jgi:hypothetical protein
MTDETSMREDLAAALDIADENYDETPQEVDTDETDIDASTAGTQENTENEGENASSGELQNMEENKPGTTTARADSKLGDEKPSTDDEPDNRSTKAPLDWSPKEREDWSRIPRHLQDKIKSREAETQELMSNTSEARKTHESFSRIGQTYGAMLSGVVAGNTPLEAAESLFSTVGNLRMGSPMQKAQIITDLINDFGVDIHTLDSALSGTAPEVTDDSRFDQMFEKRMAPMNQYMDQMNQQKEQAENTASQHAMDGVKTFADTAEFINDVRLDMADLIDMSAKRGAPLALEAAYDIACRSNPQIAEILDGRKAKEALTGSQNSIRNKRQAASSIHSPRKGVTSASGGLSMRDQISAAWDGGDE